MAYRTIKVKKYGDAIEEFTATAAITPGMLVQLDSTGADLVKPHCTADGNVLEMFALENELMGGGIDLAYASGDPVQVWIPGDGDIVLGILAASQNVAIGDFLVSNGDGYLRKWITPTSGTVTDIAANPIVGQAVNAVNLTLSTLPDNHIKVRIC